MGTPAVPRRFSRTVRISVAVVAVIALGATGVAIADTDDAPQSTAALPLVTMQGVAGQGKPLTKSTVTQGGVTDGSYWYVIGQNRTANDQNVATIVKSKLWSNKVTASKTYKPRGDKSNLLGHGNDIAWDSKRKRLLVPAWDNDNSTPEPNQSKTARIIDPKTLEVVGNQALPGSATSLCYDPANDRYIGGSGLSKLWIADGEFKQTGGGEVGLEGTSQGIDCDANYVYVLSTPKKGTSQKGSHIHVLTWDLKLVRTYAYQVDVKPDEVEHLTHQAGTFYLGFNAKRGDLCRLGKFQFHVRYKPGEGGGAMADTSVLYGVETKLRKNTFKRDGYIFAGWSAYRTSDKSVRYQNPKDPKETKWAPEGKQPSGWKPFVYSNESTIWQTTQRGGVHLTALWKKA